MKTKSEVHATAIPTEYNGVEFRSRLEAQCAFLFDKLDWNWEYEPRSFMLPNGIPYTPDFYISSIHAFWECRGYKTEKGESQINGFASMIQTPGTVYDDAGEDDWNYVVLYGDSEACTYSEDCYTGMVCAIHCKLCGWYIPRVTDGRVGVMRTFDLACRSCVAPLGLREWKRWDGKACVDRVAVITASAGKVLVNGFGIEEFRASPSIEDFE